MNKRFIIHQIAEEDLRAASKYIARDNLAAAEDFLDNVWDVIQYVQQFPEMGTPSPFHESLKSVQHFPIKNSKYILFYNATLGGIEVVRILHGARDLADLFN